MQNIQIVKRGRPAKVSQAVEFNPTDIKLFRGSDLSFSEELFKPHKTNREIDIILSTEGGLMPGTNLVLAGGPGSGKSTVALDMLADFTRQGLKCLFVSGEMDEIAHYKYCKRLPKFDCVQTLFLKNYAHCVKETLEHVFTQGYDVVAIDSIAEVIEMVKDNYKTTESQLPIESAKYDYGVSVDSAKGLLSSVETAKSIAANPARGFYAQQGYDNKMLVLLTSDTLARELKDTTPKYEDERTGKKFSGFEANTNRDYMRQVLGEVSTNLRGSNGLNLNFIFLPHIIN